MTRGPAVAYAQRLAHSPESRPGPSCAFSTLLQALDTFNTAMVSSVYYVMFTILTITASMIMYKDW